MQLPSCIFILLLLSVETLWTNALLTGPGNHVLFNEEKPATMMGGAVAAGLGDHRVAIPSQAEGQGDAKTAVNMEAVFTAASPVVPALAETDASWDVASFGLGTRNVNLT